MEIHYAVYDAPASLPLGAPLFLHIHGVSGNTLHGARYVKMAERLGFQLVAMDLSNHGESQHDGRGAAYGCREDADVAAVVDDLMTRHPGRDLYLHATSMGAMALTNAMPRILASDLARRVVAVSLENPISSVRDIVMRSPHRPPVPDLFIDLGLALASWRADVNFEACRPIDSARDVRLPVLVQWSEKDDLVPRSMIDEFFAALPSGAPARLEIFENGGHSAVWNGDPARYEDQTLANWREGLRKRAGSSSLP
jgi:alpha-beta hydrolase superfamily lysophospholipase